VRPPRLGGSGRRDAGEQQQGNGNTHAASLRARRARCPDRATIIRAIQPTAPTETMSRGLARKIHQVVGCDLRIAGNSRRTAGSRSSRTSVRSSLRFRACAAICIALLGLA
jgi:hypothetical protein